MHKQHTFSHDPMLLLEFNHTIMFQSGERIEKQFKSPKKKSYIAGYIWSENAKQQTI